MYKKLNLCIFLFALSIFQASAQSLEDKFLNSELEIRQLTDSLSQPLEDTVKKIINSKIIEIFEDILIDKASFSYPFDSLKKIGKIYSPDKQFRLYNWNIPLSDGTHIYECFIQYLDKPQSAVYLSRLKDKSKKMTNIEQQGLNSENWFGALYYEIVEKKKGRTTDYVLLGINFNDRFSNYKIIESLRFTGKGKPVFNNPCFYFGKSRKKRVLFEYNQNAVMMLKYEENIQAVVFDRLYPMEAKYKGDFRYYVPDVTNDGLVYKDGGWFFVPTIDPNNVKKNWTKKQLRIIDERKTLYHNEK